MSSKYNTVKKMVQGVGINDADYVVQIRETVRGEDGKQKRKVVWFCPYYRTWLGMLRRCYSEKLHIKNPTYIGCSVCNEWLIFSNFKSWMEKQDYEGKQLDKDLLILGNKVYSQNTCVFVKSKFNTFLVEHAAARGESPIGVHYLKKPKNMVNELSKPYVARIKIGNDKTKHLGMFATPEEAHDAWLTAKLEIAKELAAEILAEGGDPRIAKALVERYENYTSV